MKKFLILGGIGASLFLCVAGGLFAAFVWPTPYRYEQVSVDGKLTSVRVSRASGEAEKLTSNGWTPMAMSKAAPEVTCEQAKAQYLEMGEYASFVGTPPQGCDLTEARSEYECRQYRERAQSTPSVLEHQEAPLGCDISDLLTAYDQRRRR